MSASEKSCKILSVPRFALSKSQENTDRLNWLWKTTEIFEIHLKQPMICKSCKLSKHPKSLIWNHATLNTAPESLQSADAEISAGSSRVPLRGRHSAERGQLCQFRVSFTLACLLQNGYLANEVFQDVDLAKHLMGIPIWAGIMPSLFLPKA